MGVQICFTQKSRHTAVRQRVEECIGDMDQADTAGGEDPDTAAGYHEMLFLRGKDHHVSV